MARPITMARALAELEPGMRGVYRRRKFEAQYLATDPPDAAILKAAGIGKDPGTFAQFIASEADAWADSGPAGLVAAAALREMGNAPDA